MERPHESEEDQKAHEEEQREFERRKRLFESEVNGDKFNQVEYDVVSDGEDGIGEEKKAKRRKKEEEEFSGDEDDFNATQRSRQKLTHFSGEVNYDENGSEYLSKADLGKKVDGITRFNLKEENENGYFDANGEYHEVKNKDDEEIEKDVFARELAEVEELYIPPPKKEEKEEKIISEGMYLIRLCSYLGDDEVPNDAIRRYGNEINKTKQKKPKSKRHLMAFEMDDEHIPTPEEVAMYRRMIELITECCSALMEEYPNVYDMKKADLSRLIIINYSVSQKQWEYKWQVGMDGQPGMSEIYGTFNTAQMVDWHQKGCFISDPLIRRVENKKKEEEKEKEKGKSQGGSGFSAADFDADFDDDENENENEKEKENGGGVHREKKEVLPFVKNPWIPASEIDYFTD